MVLTVLYVQNMILTVLYTQEQNTVLTVLYNMVLTVLYVQGRRRPVALDVLLVVERIWHIYDSQGQT